MDFVPLLVIGALLVVLLVTSNRNKAKRAAADLTRRQAMTVGTRVMTTSGMHATIAAIDPTNDGSSADTVVLEIAPGTEVTWALAAVREAPERVVLPDTGTAGSDDDVVVDPTADAVRTPVRMVKPKGRAAE